jgi:hypothetical protein
MAKNNPFRFKVEVLVLLAVALTAFLSSCTVDCNVPDLIKAINNANANPAPSTLYLDHGCTYLLTAVDNTATSSTAGSTFEYGDNGLPQISTPITINGNDAAIIRASGAPDFRIFFITDTGELTINDLTLENGFADPSLPGGGGSAFPGSGGAIYNDNAYLEVNNSTLRDNQAGFDGGAIFGIGGTTTYINESLITENTAPSGGGIFIYHGGLLSIDNSSITDNNASNSGGGVNLEHGAELVVNASTFDANTAGRHGGGIFKDSGADHLPTTITNTTFQNNTADWGGGGVFIFRTPLTISDSIFSNNHADEYGGGLGFQDHADDTVLISNSTFDNNSALWDGGGIHFSGKQMYVNSSTIQNNTAVNGAGIHNGLATVTRYLIRDNTTLTLTSTTVQENNASGNGGGFFNEGIMTCGESDFVANQSSVLGGGIHNTGSIEILGCTFDKNKTGDDGGGINNIEIAEIRGSEFTNNTSNRGGAVSSIDGTAEISDSTFIDNIATDQGGAIFNFGTTAGSSPMEILDCEIKNNNADYGGGIASTVGTTLVSDTTISGNKAASEGGGVYNHGLMAITLSDLFGNEAKTLGGGIHNSGEITVQDSSFENNLALADGGGLNTYDRAIISGSTFVENSAFRGGGLASVGGDTELTNNTFSANTAVDSGGGIFNMGPLIGDTTPGGALQANHITVAYNSAPVGGGIATTGGGVKIKNSIVALNIKGADCNTTSIDFSSVGKNIDSDSTCISFTLKDDPLLDSLINNGGPTMTHALKISSPAIDAAPDCTALSGAVMSVDQRGQPRPGGPVCDLGAYEDTIGGPTPIIKPCIYTAYINVFCRLGPDNVLYPVVDSLKAGQSAQAIGQSWDKVFVYVEGPISEEVCAVPATERFGFLDGDCAQLPVILPPDVDESIDGEEEQEIEPDEQVQTGCTVRNPNSGALTCQVPCPPNAVPGDPCTP